MLPCKVLIVLTCLYGPHTIVPFSCTGKQPWSILHARAHDVIVSLGDGLQAGRRRWEAVSRGEISARAVQRPSERSATGSRQKRPEGMRDGLKSSLPGLRRVIRPRAVLYTLRATKTAPCRIRTVKRCVIRRYAVLGALLGGSMDTGGNCMLQGGVIRRMAVQL